MQRILRVICLCGLCLTILLGCGSDNPKTAAVTGKVLYQDEPVEGAAVTFYATEGGRPAMGHTDAQGTFQLTTFDKGDGAVLGEHKVTISKTETTGGGATGGEALDPATGLTLDEELADKMDESGGTARPPVAVTKSLIPAKYASSDTTPLTATVPAKGPDDYTFKLKD